MSKSPKLSLTKLDSLEKMCDDIRLIAEVTGYGTIWYPTKDNPSIICEVHNGLVTQTEILFIKARHDKDGTPIAPDRSVKYRSD